jgi:predicted permease
MRRVTDSLVRTWIRVSALWIPSDERERWREEWLGDWAAARGGGVSGLRAVGWAFGITRAAWVFGLEEWTMGGWVREVRHAVRGLLRAPGFALVTILTLALGIGANTAIFSVLNGVLLQPLPYEEPGELVYLTSAFPGMGFDEFWISPPEYMELQERARSFEVIGAFRENEISVGGGEQPRRVTGAFASAELFDALDVDPAFGRWYTRDEDQPGSSVVVLSHELWTRGFGAEPGLVGRSVEINGATRTVIGIAPEGFDLADNGIQVWVPMELDRSDRSNRGNHFLNLVGRLASGVSLEQASVELTQLVARWSEENPGVHVPSPDNHPMALKSLQDEVVGDIRDPLVLLMGAVGLILLIACANVANLLLARAEVRQKEVSVRVALGAGRGRLLQQFLTEGVLLSVLGGVVGVAAAWVFLGLLQASGSGDIPRLGEVGLDGTVLAFSAGVAVVTGILFGLAPARHLAGAGPARALRDGARGSTGGGKRLRSVLVVAEMGLALILVIGSGLLIRSFQALTEVDPGFEPRNALTFELYLPPGDYPEATDALAFHQELERVLEGIPGVVDAVRMDGLPPIRALSANDTEFENLERTPDGPAHNVDYYNTVSVDYLDAMGIEVIQGRGFEEQDLLGRPTALVNETLARTFFPGESVVGRRMRPCCGDQVPWLEVVGVVEDVKQGGLDAPTGTELYFLHDVVAQAGFNSRSMHVLLRTEVPPTSLTPAVRDAVWSLDAALPVDEVRSMEEVLADARARPRFLTQLLGLFGILALVLAAVGTYGVMSYSVEQRMREMGIRIALGAEAGTVRGMILRDGLGVAVIGLGIGLLGALALSGVMESVLYGVDATDLVTFVSVPLLLAGVAAVASWIPALRATRVDPVEVLKEE